MFLTVWAFNLDNLFKRGHDPPTRRGGIVFCQDCSEEIPDDSLFCPECGSRQDPSNSGAMGGRNFGVVSPQAVQATKDMQATDAAGGTAGASPSDFLNQIAGQMTGASTPPPAPQQSPASPHNSVTDQVVDQIVEAEKAEKADARNEWLAMNQQTASGVLAGLSGGDVPSHLATSSGSARFLDDGADVGLEKKRAKSNQPSTSLLRRMAVATRRVARKRGVAVESPQVALTDDDTIQVNVTYIDDGRVLDTPPDLSNAFEHAIATELALKGFDIGIEIALFRSMDGEIVWFGGILPTELTMTTMMMKKSCSLAMIVGITPFVNPTPVVQNVVPNLSMMMMRMITRNPHLAGAVLQAVALEVLHLAVQVAVQVDPLEVHPVVQVAVQVDPLEAHPWSRWRSRWTPRRPRSRRRTSQSRSQRWTPQSVLAAVPPVEVLSGGPPSRGPSGGPSQSRPQGWPSKA